MSSRTKPIYVEIPIHSSMEELWQQTQRPELHERWDLRFTHIRYLPRADDRQPQQFLYSTRIGFGLEIQGEGETVGNQAGARGQRTSALKFWSDDRKSLIREGSGFWQYESTSDGLRFITGYDYTTRFGLAGKIFDKMIFRPLLGWATAWSFDRLRLRLEQGLDPALALRQSLIYAVARLTLAFVFIYQGLIPKLIQHQPDELSMLRNAGLAESALPAFLALFGWGEVLFGLFLVLKWPTRWPFIATILFMLAATLSVAWYSSSFLSAAFNPVTLNVLVSALALIGWITGKNLPSARHCLRRKPEPK